MNNLRSRLVYGYGVSASMIADQWRKFTLQINNEIQCLSEFVSSVDFADSEKIQKIAEFSRRVQCSADFMASLCQLLLPKELSRTGEQTKEVRK